MTVPNKRTLADSLRRTERLFDSPRLKVPPVVSEKSCLIPITYFNRAKQRIVIDSFFHKQPDDMQCYLLGRALAEYVYDKVNPHILHRTGTEALQKYTDASALPLRELGQSLLNLEYSPLHKIYRLIPAYAGLLLTENFHRKQNAEIPIHADIPIPHDMVAELKMAAFMKQCDESRYYALTASASSPPTRSLVSITNETITWYLRKETWLPRLARLTTVDEYRALVKEAGIKSEILDPVKVDIPAPESPYTPKRRFMP